MMVNLIDNYNRVFHYLRLSITDLCNFNCKYCIPDFNKVGSKSYLSLSEIYNLISAFSSLGISKVRLTGGEPTVRKDFLDIGRIIASFSSIDSLVFTTNGYKLKKIAKDLRSVGFTGVNISLDSLNKNKFFVITNKNYFDNVISGIFACLDNNINVKINIVLSNFFSFFDFENFYSLLRYKNLTIRFIDQMETVNLKRKDDFYFSSFYLISFLNRNGWNKVDLNDKTSGPAVIYSNPNFLGKIGFISPYSNTFCKDCNRLRVSSSGDLFLCLFGGESYPLRSFLSSSEKKNDLIMFLLEKIKIKKKSHFLHDKDFGILKNFSNIGG
ncbi:MAG TPA: GTP 3',8-cyclase MoaA [Candidatus Azoamicus sp.]